ncbi:MAG TPA: D-amino acid aminotransferase [Alphaproteobacteria bacterium]|nr:D-amino acid aminotransferase [Alphaproteobacteria bacterium]
MPRCVYVNGRYVHYGAARVHVEDRGFQFGDAVYEVCAIRAGRLLDLDAHLARLDRSLAALRIAPPLGPQPLRHVLREVVQRNLVRDGLLYLQVSRGVAEREHAFPDPAVSPTLVIFARPMNMEHLDARAATGISVHTSPDIRWARRDIKTTGLLGNVLGKQSAREAGASEVWFVDGQGYVTEGGSTNAWIVDRRGVLRTRELSQDILPGITRETLLSVIHDSSLEFAEVPFTVREAQEAQEAFNTSALSFVTPVTTIDGVRLKGPQPGLVAMGLRQSYLNRVDSV